MARRRTKVCPPPEYRLETLETRVLFSADTPFSAILPVVPEVVQVVAPVSVAGGIDADAFDAVATPRELVIIDAGVPDIDALLADIARQGESAPRVVVLEAGEDALGRLSDIFSGEKGLSAVHLISHGSDGALELGGERVTSLDLLAHAGDIVAWRGAFADGADFLLYGCDVAASGEGRAFVDTLARLTNTDVAASSDVTGAQGLGGDWTLEYRRGEVQGELAFSEALQEDYSASLAAPVLVNNALTITEGGTVIFSATEFSATDADTADDALTFSVSSISGGRFEFVASPGTTITSFTQQEVTNGDVQFVHVGGETAPTYSVTVSDGVLSDGPSAASVSFTNVNKAPNFYAAGGPTFSSHDIAIDADAAYSVARADVDGDGDMDVLSASFNDNRIVWYENDGSESFTAHTIATDASGAISVMTADVDSDGDVDVLSASSGDDRIVWYENDGSESFTAHTIVSDADGARSVATADVDGDGDMDVLSASFIDDRIVWYENDGSESFTARTIASDADGAHSVTTADVDGDGDVDVLSASQFDDRIVWFENDGSESFTARTIATDADGALSVATADVDGDGDVDVLSASYLDDRIVWYENDGSESFTTHTIASDTNSARSVTTADVDGDGDLDVLSASFGDDRIVWFENDGSENFTARTIASDADGAQSVTTADVDGDGDVDVLSASYLDDRIVWYENDLNTLDGNPTFVEGGAAVVLDADIAVSDAELDAINGGNGNYAGVELSVVRTGVANAEDVLDFNDGNGLSLVGGNLIKNGQVVASFDTSSTAGELV